MKQTSVISPVFTSVLILLLLFTSCENKTIDVSKIVAERDSLIALNSLQRNELENLDSCLLTISNCLDSITLQEDMLISQSKEGPIKSPAELKKSIEEFGKMLARQRSKITLLEDSLSKKQSKSPELQKIISFLNSQLEAKENQIAQLKSQINSQSRDIKVLKNNLASTNQKLATLSEETETQKDIISTQDRMINTGYILIGTKSDLSDAGVLSKKFLSSPKLVSGKLTPNMCQSVDIRKVTEISLGSSKPKILTSHPQDSYAIQKSGGKSSILIIKDVSLFWRHSNYLVILL